MGQAFPPRLKLHHQTPAWVPDAAVYHVRIRCEHASAAALTSITCGPALLKSTELYHNRHRWCCHLLLLMPDHLHTLLSFPKLEAMSRVIGEWKHYHTRHTQIAWQEGYFDHRIRNAEEFALKAEYIHLNPVVKGLCLTPADWPWVCTPTLS